MSAGLAFTASNLKTRPRVTAEGSPCAHEVARRQFFLQAVSLPCHVVCSAEEHVHIRTIVCAAIGIVARRRVEL